MSVAVKIATGFPALGIVATSSLALAKHNQIKEIKESLREEAAPPLPATPIPQVSISKLIQKVVEEKGYEGCAELINRVRLGPLWFVCASKKQLNKPALYSYNRTRENRDLIVAHVTSITSSAGREKEMILESGVREKIKFPPSWIHKLRGKDLTPESDCNFTENRKSNGKVSYKLTCHSEVIQDEIEFENKTNK